MKSDSTTVIKNMEFLVKGLPCQITENRIG